MAGAHEAIRNGEEVEGIGQWEMLLFRAMEFFAFPLIPK